MELRITKLLKDFIDSEKAGGIVLLACTIISLIVANSAAGHGYTQFWHQPINLSFSTVNLNYSIQHWVNDGLMAIFFLLVGLEIERELYIGELKDLKVSSLPIAAAVGGMLVPAAIHFFFNNGTPEQSGFGVPMATDIAFALGMLTLAGSRVPLSLKIFLTALAIIDDIGAIVVIALFYSGSLSWGYLTAAVGIFALLYILGRLKVYHLAAYLLPGIVAWYCMMKSGIHASISGVLLAFVIPFGNPGPQSPSHRLQHFLHKPVAFFILPVFALANTGIILQPGWQSKLLSVNSLGIMLGLVLGKPIGILLFCWLLIKLKWGSLPSFVTWKHITGAGMLAGIGFTMSIFISNLAFNSRETVQLSKISVLTGSAISCLVGLSWLFIATKKNEKYILDIEN
ncbi:MAG: Na+/H+ antiporter NhaA [Chitinophagaceae bacterium]